MVRALDKADAINADAFKRSIILGAIYHFWTKQLFILFHLNYVVIYHQKVTCLI